MNLDPSTADLLKNLLTWFLVVIGWMIVSDQQAGRELAKNCYARLQVLREDLKKIEKEAILFHTSQFDLQRIRSLMRIISELGVETSHLRRENSLSTELSFHMARFRKAITYSNFDHSTHQVLSLDSNLLEEIAIAKDLLDRALLDASQSISTTQPTLAQSIKSSFKRII